MSEERGEPSREGSVRRTSAVLLPFLVAGLVGGLLGCGGEAPNGDAETRAAQAERELVRTAPPERRDFERTEPWFGQVESRSSVPVTALAAGRIEAVQVADGAPVKRSQPLFRLGGPEASARRKALAASVSSLEERLRLASRAAKLKAAAAREKLVRRDEVLQARAERDRLAADLAAARQELAREERALELTAPAAGTFARRAVNVGQDVAAGDTLAQIVATGSLRIVATLYPASSREASDLEGKSAIVDDRGPDGGGEGEAGRPLAGTVARVLPDRTPDGGTQVWIEGPDVDRGLRPGEVVSGHLVLTLRRGALAVPEAAVVQDDAGHPFVFVAGTGGYEKRPVVEGLSSDGWVEIVSGVAPDARVVVEGAYELYYRDFAKTFRVAD